MKKKSFQKHRCTHSAGIYKSHSLTVLYVDLLLAGCCSNPLIYVSGTHWTENCHLVSYLTVHRVTCTVEKKNLLYKWELGEDQILHTTGVHRAFLSIVTFQTLKLLCLPPKNTSLEKVLKSSPYFIMTTLTRSKLENLFCIWLKPHSSTSRGEVFFFWLDGCLGSFFTIYLNDCSKKQ